MTECTDEVSSAYDQWAAQYDGNSNPTRDLNAKLLRELCPDPASKRVLEIGCGTGLNTVWLAASAKAVTGIDLSDGMLAINRRKVAHHNNVDLLKADITRPWPSIQRFDLVVINLVLEHVSNLQPVFVQARAALDSGGQLYVAEFHPYKQLRGSQARFADAVTGQDVLVPAFTHPVSEIVNTAVSSGFKLCSMGEWKNNSDEIFRLLTLVFDVEDSQKI